MSRSALLTLRLRALRDVYGYFDQVEEVRPFAGAVGRCM